MDQLAAVRIYFPNTATLPGTRFWHKLVPRSFGHHLLKSARKAGIEQVLHHAVHAGYLPGQPLTVQTVEIATAHHPNCIELIDIEKKLRAFIQLHANDLKKASVILHRCERLE